MPKLEILDKTSAPGSTNRVNEDASGSNDHAAFVIDGATGLGNKQIMPDAGSDAAWLASFAAEKLATEISPDRDVSSIVRCCIVEARATFKAANHGELPERFAWPSASFVLLQINESNIQLSGLGDCVVYAAIGDRVAKFSPLLGFPDVERGWASRHIDKAGGFGEGSDLLSNPETLDDLRMARSLQNTSQGGVWTLGLEPAAADHLVVDGQEILERVHCLLCSDGFSALVDSYGAYAPETLIEAAISHGLTTLVDELRHIETKVDPDGKRFPRFKRSDDATALLLRIDPQPATLRIICRL